MRSVLFLMCGLMALLVPHRVAADPLLANRWWFSVRGESGERKYTGVIEGREVPTPGQQPWSCYQLPIQRFGDEKSGRTEMMTIACGDNRHTVQADTSVICGSGEHVGVGSANLRVIVNGKSYSIYLGCINLAGTGLDSPLDH